METIGTAVSGRSDAVLRRQPPKLFPPTLNLARLIVVASSSCLNRMEPSERDIASLVAYVRLGIPFPEAFSLWPYRSRYRRDVVEASLASHGVPTAVSRHGRRYRTRYGETTVSEAIRASGCQISPHAVRYRMNQRGMSLDEAVSVRARHATERRAGL